MSEILVDLLPEDRDDILQFSGLAVAPALGRQRAGRDAGGVCRA
ncbi:MAG TPA: hypothetical protein VMT79_14475 [Candidatus Binatia bacterium]|nr:hypothetical protein [Candidatus Binatia bacterium]